MDTHNDLHSKLIEIIREYTDPVRDIFKIVNEERDFSYINTIMRVLVLKGKRSYKLPAEMTCVFSKEKKRKKRREYIGVLALNRQNFSEFIPCIWNILIVCILINAIQMPCKEIRVPLCIIQEKIVKIFFPTFDNIVEDTNSTELMKCIKDLIENNPGMFSEDIEEIEKKSSKVYNKLNDLIA